MYSSLVYYKIFDIDNDGLPCESRQPIYPANPFIGRIDTSLIPPPHTVSSLVERICKKEGRGFGCDWDNNDAFSTVLFKTISSPEPFKLHDSFPLLSNDRPGSSPLEPVILNVGYKGMFSSSYLHGSPLSDLSWQTFGNSSLLSSPSGHHDSCLSMFGCGLGLFGSLFPLCPAAGSSRTRSSLRGVCSNLNSHAAVPVWKSCFLLLQYQGPNIILFTRRVSH